MDTAAILALNNAHAAETSLLTAGRLAWLLASASHVGLVDEGRTAFLIAFDGTGGYDSPNYFWFRARWPRFSYVDRVVTAVQARGQGHARSLYQDLFGIARRAGHTRIGCEVNLQPPNPRSDAFHARLGFSEAGRAALPGGKVVRYLARSLVDG